MLRCKSATLTTNGGVNTVWQDDKDLMTKYELYFSPETAKAYIDFSNQTNENEKESEEE